MNEVRSKKKTETFYCINYVVVLIREEKGSSEKVYEKERNWLVFITSVVEKKERKPIKFHSFSIMTLRLQQSKYLHLF